MVSHSYIPVVIAILIMIAGDFSIARELRPSYHGLDYQSMPPSGEKLPPEMKEFFGSSSSSPTSKSSSNVALPKAMNNSNETAWWKDVSGDNGGGGKGGDSLRHILLVASLACGVTGAALLVASAFIYFVKYKSKQTSPSDHSNNSKALAIIPSK